MPVIQRSAIYEIKKFTTNLLRKDESRGNYYWDVEIAKGIDVRVMKPRAFIIAGHREQLTNETTEDNFRILNRALKNVEIVLYDELLDNVKNFLKRLRK